MLLRRITKHVTDQNWFAVFIDFLIVVVGILIAFQITNWSEAQSDKADAQEYIKRLVSDMEISIDQNSYQITTAHVGIKEFNLILNALESCQLSADNKPVFAAGLYNMGKYDLPAMVMNTIDELNATGKFSLIGDAELRRLITEAVREFHRIIAIDPQISARTIPSINYVRTHVRFSLDEHLTHPTSIDPDKVDYNFDELCVDKTFISAIATVREITLASLALNQRVNSLQVEILDALRSH